MPDHSYTLAHLEQLEGDALKAALIAVLRAGDVPLFNQYRDATYWHPIDLRDADLRYSNLFKADLSNANLSVANLFNADLRNADLRDANLSNATLLRANLRAATFQRTQLAGADFIWARLDDTIFSAVDLSEALHLEEAEHLGPSSIDIDTLVQSKGNIPEVFLRGCGVPDTVIAFARSLVAKPIDFYSCFISYSHADKEFARQLHDRLQGEGIRCWLDEKQINPGDDLMEEVERGIRYWDKVVLCCSQASLTSWWCDNELDNAFTIERQLFKERGGRQIRKIIPLDLDGFLFSEAYRSAKKAQLLKRLAANFRGWDSDNAIFREGVEAVIKALRTDGDKEDPPPPKL